MSATPRKQGDAGQDARAASIAKPGAAGSTRVKTLTSTLLLQTVVDERNLRPNFCSLQQLRQRDLGLPDKVVFSALVVVKHLRETATRGGARDGLEATLDITCEGQEGRTLSGAQLGRKAATQSLP
jgi:hypothetical protein